MKTRYEIECNNCETVLTSSDDPREAFDLAIASSCRLDHEDHIIRVAARGYVHKWRFEWVNRNKPQVRE